MTRREFSPKAELSRQVDGYRNALFQAGAVRIAPNKDSLLILRNGGPSWVFVDHGLLLPNPKTNRVFVDAMSSVIQMGFPRNTTILANVDSKSSPQTTGTLAYELGYRQIAVNPEATTQAEHGLGLRLRMPEVNPGDTILIVDDALTTGRTVGSVAHLIRQELGETADKVQIHLLVGLLRNDKAVAELAQQRIPVHHLLTLKELLENERGQLHLTEEQREGLKSEGL